MFEKALAIIKNIPRQYYFPLVMAILGVIFFGYGLIQFFGQRQPQSVQTIMAEVPTGSSVKTVKTISVDVEGAVFHTGVFTLAENSRVQDALIKAGGLDGDADRDFVAKHINLASKLTDGAKIYIPRKGEDILDGASTVNTVNGVAVTFLNINTTSADNLDSLPGVGPATAEKIINNRPYATIQELVTKKVISQRVFDEIKDKIVAE
jgi:competence protein ComEA